MRLRNDIIIVDDDADDREIITQAIRSLGFDNKIIAFDDGEKAFPFLKSMSQRPFMIFCDIRMAKVGGIELRERINADERLRKKSIPFVFMTGSADQNDVEHAYRMSVQGFFTKPDTIDEWKEKIGMILRYWEACIHPGDP